MHATSASCIILLILITVCIVLSLDDLWLSGNTQSNMLYEQIVVQLCAQYSLSVRRVIIMFVLYKQTKYYFMVPNFNLSFLR
jgi:hypothetical protein